MSKAPTGRCPCWLQRAPEAGQVLNCLARSRGTEGSLVSALRGEAAEDSARSCRQVRNTPGPQVFGGASQRSVRTHRALLVPAPGPVTSSTGAVGPCGQGPRERSSCPHRSSDMELREPHAYPRDSETARSRPEVPCGSLLFPSKLAHVIRTKRAVCRDVF